MKLYHGDCLDVLPTVASGSVDMIFADLPYGVTANRWDTVIPLASLWEQLLRVGKKNCAFVFTATQPFATALINSQPKLFRYDLVWQKRSVTGFLNVNKMPLRSYELVLIFYRRSPTYNPQMTFGHPPWRKGASSKHGTNYHDDSLSNGAEINDGSRHPTAVLSNIDESDLKGFRQKRTLHPTQKPVALLEWLLKTYSNPGDTILDPTMGSGTTGAACVHTGRDFIGIEKDATYFATAQSRIAQATQPLEASA